MRILVTNDDGIDAPGIRKLVEKALELGEVTLVAPAGQCSAMSQKITIASKMYVERVEYTLPVKAAYKVFGTPADCVKLALYNFFDEKPDIVFSGINAGYNSGTDIVYSGTVGAAMESLVAGVPAIAFSTGFTQNYGAIDALLADIVREIMTKKTSADEIWNVNIPDCDAADCKGVLWNRIVADKGFYDNLYTLEKDLSSEITGMKLRPCELPAVGEKIIVGVTGVPTESVADGTDVAALMKGYASVGKISSRIPRSRG
ncbi:MAG: 5'/3'-nucleotidase SurE [Lachnospiraceae bacterium]|nr:5'/3'-nucleotidase SurE [Lachnospiraceae bacterium]